MFELMLEPLYNVLFYAEKTEDPPAKLLDDLFRKTKAAPCIYWLPLTDEQVRNESVLVLCSLRLCRTFRNIT